MFNDILQQQRIDHVNKIVDFLSKKPYSEMAKFLRFSKNDKIVRLAEQLKNKASYAPLLDNVEARNTVLRVEMQNLNIPQLLEIWQAISNETSKKNNKTIKKSGVLAPPILHNDPQDHLAFISHHHSCDDRASEIAKNVESNCHIKCFVDGESIKPGQKSKDVIKKNAREATILIVLHSKEWSASKECAKEVTQFFCPVNGETEVTEHYLVLVLKLDNTEVTHDELKAVQYIDCNSKTCIEDKTKNIDIKAMTKITNTINEFIAKPKNHEQKNKTKKQKRNKQILVNAE